MKNKYLWYTDLHLDKVAPWNLLRFVYNINKENPKGLFLTGDISNGLLSKFHMSFLAKHIDCPIYFVLGNHSYHFSNFQKQHQTIRELCQEYPNLIWLNDSQPIPLSEEVALIGTEGWYDASSGNPKYLMATFDWLLIEDFRKLSSFDARIEAFRKLADQSCQIVEEKLVQALEQDFKTVYLCTHFPPFNEATRDIGTIFEKYWLPYNVNYRLGKTLEKIMKNRNKRHLVVLAGHTHLATTIHVSRNIECHVGEGHYLGLSKHQRQIIYI